MRSLYYHVIILGEPKVDILRVIEKNSKDIKRFSIAKHEGHVITLDKKPHTHLAIHFHEPKLPIWISRRFKVKFQCIQRASGVIFQYVK